MGALDITGLGDVANLATGVINKIWPDKSAQEAQELAAAVALVQGQLSINQTEAASRSVFVSGWRPFVGWVCGSACAWNWIGLPIAKLVLAIVGVKVLIEPADISQMMPLLMALLGLGGMRTVEKIQGVAAK